MKSVIITGAGSGLGKELALLFAGQGFHIILTGRTLEKLQSVEQEIHEAGGSAQSYTVDITQTKDISKLMTQLQNHELYGLINNAGVGHFGPVNSLSAHDIQEMFETNTLGTIYMTQAVLPLLKEKNEGLLMNIISTAGLKGKVNESVYVASKFAVRGFTESLQKELENTNIKVKAVYMGGMDTPFWDENDHIKDKSRLRSPKAVAAMILDHIEEDSIVIESKK
ncbi:MULTISPECIES: SDR family NAD(P)-dependent oxidoreductase [Bacillaceae]|jgi:short-subunit dehydrogenase|uniref:Oxidoreductase, short-chain dehydrogenase/reductase family n=1 Tax=Cytobacillus firmus TaxID=1399 RepID=A0A0J5VMX1_CYTFI|nr:MULTISPECIES: SDR family oxidoreductase [Bacillaceae]KAF0824829.1 Oxidoreductase, short-chain dehydrogenase/reductase family [Cytobacillus firmus]KML36160.1 short-chain dehydrogenase [Cytobacillus firmus]MBG9654325.1 short-chain dehydrogenase [Cytobacillus firmus]MCC3649443.1 SDR family oxidoreductase [Cytobacillus oceanisediminis]MCU1807517.1 SDR family oxidoreductase [Cytobacillus firmus]